MKRRPKLTKRDRKALAAQQTAAQTTTQTAPKVSAYDLELKGVKADDPIVQQVVRAMATPAVKYLLDNPLPMHCSLYAQALYGGLENTAGWEYVLLVQNGDYHISLCHSGIDGDTFADLAMDGNPSKRSVFRMPRAAFESILGALGGVVTYHATPEDLARAATDAGFEAELRY